MAKPNYGALDAVRGIAVLYVFLRHAAYLSDPSIRGGLPYTLETFFLNGWLGVDLFFVLSGFLIFQSLDRAQSTRHYFQRRFLRIVPAYVAVLCLAVFGLFPYYLVDDQNIVHRVLLHLVFLQDYLGSDIVVVFWTLGIEVKFYLLAPLLYTLIKKANRAASLLFAALLIALTESTFRWLSYSELTMQIDYAQYFYGFRSPFHMSFMSIWLGFLLAKAHALHLLDNSPRIKRWAIALACASCVLLCVVELMHTITWFDVFLQPLAISILATLVVAAAATSASINNRAVSGLSYIGRISYSLYLLHVPLLPLSHVLSAAIFPGNSLAFLLTYFAISLAASAVFYRWVESYFYRRAAAS